MNGLKSPVKISYKYFNGYTNNNNNIQAYPNYDEIKAKNANEFTLNQQINERYKENFLHNIVSLILDDFDLIGKDIHLKNEKVVEFMHPKELENQLKLEINKDGLSDDELVKICRKVIKYSVKTCHPFFFNQLYGGTDKYGLAGAWISEALNTSQATYEISPVFTILERQMIKYCGLKCGWKEYNIDGLFSPGGSLANMYGMELARYNMFPESKENGINGFNNLVAFCSDNAHYSFVKSANWMGIGTKNIIKIKTDIWGKMIPQELEKSIVKHIVDGKKPFLVACTAGTTVLSAFDPLRPISVICKKYNLWMHVDAALGGTFLLSPKYRHFLDGIELADSVTWNMHKLAGVPFQCSLFLTQHPNILRDVNSLKAEYLFQSDKYYDSSYDTGDKSIQCGRKVESFKLWLSLVAKGEDKIISLVDNIIEINKYMVNKLRNREGFKLVLPDYQGASVCFWYIPKALRCNSELDQEKLHRICPLIKAKMMESGSLMINYQPLTCKNLPNFFRLSLTCIPPSTKKDMDFIVEEIERIGESIDI